MAVFGLPAPIAIFQHQPAQVSERHERLGQWTLIIRHDRFAASTTCQLRARDMVVAHGAVTFRFGSRTPTYEAVYRVDDGPPQSWRTNAMTLAAEGALVNGESLANPSEGLVPTPLATLAGAQSITIRPSPSGRLRKFQLGDLPAALRAADAAGCEGDLTGESAR